MGKSIKFLIILALTLLFSGIIFACAESSTLPHDEDKLMSISVENANLEIYNDAIDLPIIHGHYESGKVEVLPYHELYFEGENTYAFDNQVHLKHDAKAEFGETIKISHQSDKNIKTEINIKREFVAANSIQAISYGYKSRLLKNSKWAVDTRFYPSNTTNKAVKYYLDDYAHASIEGNVVTVKSTASFGDTFIVTAVIEEISGKQQRLTSSIRFEVADYIPLYTKEDLINIEKDGAADYKLMNDIDLGEVDKFGNNWYMNNEFWGTLDGNGYTIRNLTMNANKAERSFMGLIAVNNGIVKNLNIENASFTAMEHWQGTNLSVGAIAGHSRGIIENCKILSASFNLIQNSHAGGIVGVTSDNDKRSVLSKLDKSFQATVINCSASVSFYGASNFGAIVGYAYTSKILNCSVQFTTISCFQTFDSHYGGIAAALFFSTISNCSVSNVEFNYLGVGKTTLAYTHVSFAAVVAYCDSSEISSITIKNITKNIDMLYLGKVEGFRYTYRLCFNGPLGAYGFNDYSTFTNIKEIE